MNITLHPVLALCWLLSLLPAACLLYLLCKRSHRELGPIFGYTALFLVQQVSMMFLGAWWFRHGHLYRLAVGEVNHRYSVVDWGGLYLLHMLAFAIAMCCLLTLKPEIRGQNMFHTLVLIIVGIGSIMWMMDKLAVAPAYMVMDQWMTLFVFVTFILVGAWGAGCAYYSPNLAGTVVHGFLVLYATYLLLSAAEVWLPPYLHWTRELSWLVLFAAQAGVFGWWVWCLHNAHQDAPRTR